MTHWAAGAQALLVTFLWSTSFVITKWVYAEGMGPLTLGGLRYGLAALVLAGVWRWQRRRMAGAGAAGAAGAPGLPWWLPPALGLAGYTLTQGGQHLGLFVLAPTQVSLILGVHNTLQVLLWSGLLLREWPTAFQAGAILAALGGVVLYHYPWELSAADLWGAVPVLAAGIGYAWWIVGNRRWLAGRGAGALSLTLPSMAWGAAGLLLLAAAVEGVPAVTPRAAAYLLFLAVVNTAFAFTLWTHTQRTLAAFESSLINNTMLVQIALLSLWLLDQPITPLRWTAIGVVTASTVAVHLAPYAVRAAGARRAGA